MRTIQTVGSTKMTSVHHFLIALPLIVLVLVVGCESESDRRKEALAEWFVDARYMFSRGDGHTEELFERLAALESPWESGRNALLFEDFILAHQLMYHANALSTPLEENIQSLLDPDEYFGCNSQFSPANAIHADPISDVVYAQAGLTAAEVSTLCANHNLASENLSRVYGEIELYALKDEIKSARNNVGR